MRKIAISFFKGGAAKSSSAIELSSSLSKLGAEVLLVDTDLDGQIAKLLKLNPRHSLTHILKGLIGPQEAITHTKWGFDVIGSDRDLIKVDAVTEKRSRLRNALSPIKGYDHVIFDTSPNYGMMSANVLDYADTMIVPVELSPASRDRLANIYNELDEARITNPKLFIRGILPVKYRRRESSQQAHYEQLKRDFKDVFEPIPFSCVIEQAQCAGMPVTIKYPNHPISQAYILLAKQIKED